MKTKTNISLKPARMPFFYGWLILIIGALGVTMSIPGQTMGVSVFTDDLIDVLGLSRVRLSLAYLVGTITSAIILTPAGKTLDKIGERKMGAIVTVLLGLVLVFLSRIDRVVGALQKYINGADLIIAFATITISFFLLRFLGQGMLTMLSRNMVMKWFDRYRGFANAILGIVTSFVFSIAPRFLNSVIEDYDWNGAWIRMGLLIMSIGAFLFWLISRDSPRVCGLEPDGKIRMSLSKKRPAAKPRKDFTLAQARKTLPFWIFGLTCAMSSLFMTAFTFHVVSIFESAGMSRLQAVAIFLPASFVSIGINFSVSLLSDYVKLRYILILQIVSIIFTMFFLSRLSTGVNMIMLIIGYGILNGVFNISTSVVWPRYYGTEHLGAITGMIMGFIVAGSAIGPYFYSLIFDLTGSYSLASIICLAVMCILLIFSFFVRRPVHPDFKED